MEVEAEDLSAVPGGAAQLAEGEGGGGRGRGGGEEVVAAVVEELEGIVSPLDVWLEAVQPGLAKDDIKALERCGVEGVDVGVGADGEALAREEEEGGLEGAVGEVDLVRGDLGGGVEAVAVGEGGVDEVALAAAVDEDAGRDVVEVALEDQEVGASGAEVEGVAGRGGGGVGGVGGKELEEEGSGVGRWVAGVQGRWGAGWLGRWGARAPRRQGARRLGARWPRR
jgi:hypothetical protein